MTTRRGITLAEVIAASIIAALVAGGSMMAFVMAASMTKQDSAITTEAAFYAEQTLERFRNRIACDDAWFTNPNCASPGQAGADTLPPAPNGVDSPLLDSAAARNYEMVPADCDGDGTPGDCYQVTVHVQWTGAK